MDILTNLKEFCNEHLWAPSCYHGSVGNGWDVVEKYIQTQDKNHAKTTAIGLILKFSDCMCIRLNILNQINNR